MVCQTSKTTIVEQADDPLPRSARNLVSASAFCNSAGSTTFVATGAELDDDDEDDDSTAAGAATSVDADAAEGDEASAAGEASAAAAAVSSSCIAADRRSSKTSLVPAVSRPLALRRSRRSCTLSFLSSLIASDIEEEGGGRGCALSWKRLRETERNEAAPG